MADTIKKMTPEAQRKFAANKPQEQQTVAGMLQSSAGFMVVMSLLIIGTGMILFVAYRNHISRLILDVGLIIFLISMAIKILDVFVKIIGGRKR